MLGVWQKLQENPNCICTNSDCSSSKTVPGTLFYVTVSNKTHRVLYVDVMRQEAILKQQGLFSGSVKGAL